MPFLSTLRQAVLQGASATGLRALVARSPWRTRRLMVLCYHGVSFRDEHEWYGLYVSAQHLARRLQRLRELGCTVVPLADGLERMASGDLPPRAVALTFDDGTADFIARAVPVLEAFETPAMLYQTTWYVGKPYPVFNTMSSYVMWKGGGQTATLPWRSAPEFVPTRAEDPAFQALHRALLQWVDAQGLSGDAQHALLLEIAQLLGVDMAPLLDDRLLALMTRDELNRLDPALIDLQLHTHRHRTPRDHRLFVRELDDNKRALEQLVDRPLNLRHFCYPSGVHFPEYGPWLREWGALSATTCDMGLHGNDVDAMYIPRLMDMPHTPDVIFDAWVTGTAALFPGRGRV